MDDEASGDPAVDGIVSRAAEAATLPTADHNGLYTSLMEALQRELDADPAAAIAGGTPGAPAAPGAPGAPAAPGAPGGAA